jgi:hypothetical protein
MHSKFLQTRLVAAAFIATVTVPFLSRADFVLPLIPLDPSHVWKYEQSGTDLGTEWRGIFYEDSGWAEGGALFGLEDAWLPPPSLNTLLTFTFPQQATFYFRTHFDFPSNTAGVTLVASNLIDDGAAFYLNGVEVARIGMPAGTINYSTFASRTVGDATTFDVTNLNATPLVQGDNVLAVEVHQVSATSSDIVFGMNLVALVPQAPEILVSPASQSVVAGAPVNFSVEAVGTRIGYLWYKDNVLLAGATSNHYSIARAHPTNAGSYRVVVTNFLGSATSSVATLTVNPDVFPPLLVSANVLETGATNTLQVTFSEPMLGSTLLNRSNYALTQASTGGGVVVSNTNPGAAANVVFLRVGGPNWRVGDPYVLTVSNAADAYTNAIAPNSQIGVAFFRQVFPADETWKYFYDPANATDPGPAWLQNGYNDDAWPSAAAGFYLSNISLCVPTNTLLTDGAIAHYFRVRFTAPANTGMADLQLRHWLDDGAAFYLNGQRVFSYNMPTNTPINYLTPASAAVNIAACLTNAVTVSNVLSGENVLAAELHQFNPNGGDAAFALGLRAAITPALNLGPRIQITRPTPTTVTLTWQGDGYILESAANVTGPTWSTEASNVNSFTTIATGPRKFFRLRK